MNYSKFMMLGIMIMTSTVSEASSISCPSTVLVGQSLTVQAIFTNRDCESPKILKNSVVSLLGNYSGTVGLQGPFVKPFEQSTIVPKADCEIIPWDPEHPEWGGYSYVTQEGQVTIDNLVVLPRIPNYLKDKLIVAAAGALNDNNKLIVAGSCIVTVN